MTTTQIIDKILGLTRKNQKRIITDAEASILTTFRDGGELEKKEITKLKKILAKYVKQTLPLKPEVIFGQGTFFKGKSLSQSILGVRMYLSDDIMCFPKPDGYEIQKMRGLENLTATDKFMISVVEETMTIIQTQLVDVIKEYTKEQDAAALRRRQEVIKGQVTKEILAGLMEIRDKWEIVIYNNTLAYLKTQRTGAIDFIGKVGAGPFPRTPDGKANADSIIKYMQCGVINTSKQPVSDRTLEEISHRVAKDEADSFLLKMCDKIGGLKLSPSARIESTGGGRGDNPFSSTLKVIDTFGSFNMFNQIVLNWTNHGNPYHQYPCVFENIHINDQRFARMSEYQIKTAINKLHLQN